MLEAIETATLTDPSGSTGPKGSSATPEIASQLLENPRPLIHADEKFVVFWSGKSACTSVLRWTFHRMGLLEAADYFGWIHQFRTKVYYESARYKRVIAKYDQRRYRHIRVVRDPFARTVSAYLHSLEQGYERERIANFLTIDRPYSFAEFVGYLRTVDLDVHNIHFTRQSSAAERSGDLVLDHVIRIEDGLFDGLQNAECAMGLDVTDFDAVRIQSKHRSDYSAAATFVGDQKHAPGTRVAAPAYQWFYNDQLIELVARLYASDFERYGYDTTIPSSTLSRNAVEGSAVEGSAGSVPLRLTDAA